MVVEAERPLPPPPPPAEVRTIARSDPRVATAVGGACRCPRRRGGVVVAGIVALLFVEAEADVALQGRRGQPLLREAALQEGDAGAEVGQPVDPARDFSSTQQLKSEQKRVRWRGGSRFCGEGLRTPSHHVTDLRQRGGEVVAVLVHQVVGVASEILPQLLHDFIDVLLREVRGAQNNGLPAGRAQRWAPCTCQRLRKHTHLNLKVSPSSAALPGLISKMPLKGYG